MKKINARDVLTEREYGYDWEDIHGYVTDVFLEADDETNIHIIVFEYKGELWGFKDWFYSEVGNGLSEDIGIDGKIEIFPVESYTVTSYREVKKR